MRKLHLHRASVTNAGAFIDAGNDIGVGPADDHIDTERADQLVESGGAIEVKTPPAPAKARAE